VAAQGAATGLQRGRNGLLLSVAYWAAAATAGCTRASRLSAVSEDLLQVKMWSSSDAGEI